MQREPQADRENPDDFERFLPNNALLAVLRIIEREAKQQPEYERKQLEAYFQLR